MKRKYYKLADGLMERSRWSWTLLPPMAAFAAVIWAGYDREALTPETGFLLIFLLAVSILICNPFGALDWALAPASRITISAGSSMVYAALRIPGFPPYCMAVTSLIGAAVMALGVCFRKRWHTTWADRQERRRYQLSIFQCQAVDDTIGQLKAGSETAALDAWEDYGNAQCRALLHQWAELEISEEEIEDVGFPVWILAYGSAFSDRADLQARHQRELERLEKEKKAVQSQLWALESEQKDAAYYASQRAEAQAEATRLWEENQSLKRVAKELRLLLEEAHAEPEALETLEAEGSVVRMFPKAQEEQADVVPVFQIAGVAVPADLREQDRVDLAILEYYEQGHSHQDCAEAFRLISRNSGQPSRKTAESRIKRGKLVRQRLLSGELEAVGE